MENSRHELRHVLLLSLILSGVASFAQPIASPAGLVGEPKPHSNARPVGFSIDEAHRIDDVLWGCKTYRWGISLQASMIENLKGQVLSLNKENDILELTYEEQKRELTKKQVHLDVLIKKDDRRKARAPIRTGLKVGFGLAAGYLIGKNIR